MYYHLIILLLFFTSSGCKKEQKSTAEPTPESYSMSDFKKVPKIDTHAHITSDGKTFIEEARANNFRLMDMIVDVPQFPSITRQLEICQKHRVEDADVFAYTTAFTLEDWDQPDWSDGIIEQLQKDFEKGALGVKVWKNIGMTYKDRDGNLIMLDNPKFDPIFSFIKDQNKILLSHAGEPKNCWLPLDEMTVNNDRNYFGEYPEFHMYLHPEMPSYEDQIQARNNMLSKNTELTFIGVHLASLEWSVDEIGKFLDQFPNASVDLTERIPHLQYQSLEDRNRVRDFFVKYQDRITYGTDFEDEDHDTAELKERMNARWTRDWKYFNTEEIMTVPELDAPIQGLGLTKAVVDKIYRVNAEKLFKDAWEVPTRL
jgi:predicted TIM-barrel fold metal-dependent hydrolase